MDAVPNDVSVPLGAPNRKLVVDTGAFNRSAYLDKTGDEIYTTPGVLQEIKRYRDSNPLAAGVRTLSDPITREPTDEDVAFVKCFASKTGDLATLSENDIACIALVRRLQIETGNVEKLKSEPMTLTIDDSKGKASSAANAGVGAFDKWIGPDNLYSYNVKNKSESDATVACMTTDFAMQNVLMQMGLDVITLDGFAVKTVKNWGQLCRACFEVYPNVQRQFCSKCGNATVERVPLEVDAVSGKLTIKDNRRWINTRGTIYTQPKPSVGSNKQLYIVAEDQMLMPGYKNHVRNLNRKSKMEKLIYDEDPKGPTGKNTKSGNATDVKIPVGLGRGNPNSNRWMQRHKGMMNPLK